MNLQISYVPMFNWRIYHVYKINSRFQDILVLKYNWVTTLSFWVP